MTSQQRFTQWAQREMPKLDLTMTLNGEHFRNVMTGEMHRVWDGAERQCEEARVLEQVKAPT